MNETGPIRYRCFCFECEPEDNERKPIGTSDAGGPPTLADDDDNGIEGARTIAGAIERLLFGGRNG